MWIVRLALRRPYTIATFCLIIALLGGLSITRMKVDMLPAIDIPVVLVVWTYTGLSADEVEKRVTFLSERAYSSTVSGISRIESQSIPGIALVKVYFEPGSDVGGAIAQISAVSSTVLRNMPPGMTPPIILRYNASNVPVAQLTVSSETLNEQQLFDYGLNFLRLRLFTVPGLSVPAPFGGKQRQIMVDVDPARVAAKGLALQDVVNAILNNNVTVPAGTARIGRTEYDVQLNSSPEQLADFNQMPLKLVSGVPVLLKDVAFVHDGFAVQNNIVRVNGKHATYLTIIKKADASTLSVVTGAKDLLPTLQATAPQGMTLKVDFDQSVFVRGAVNGVLHEALIAAVLVSLMILFFLGSWRSTVLVGLSIPLSILVGITGLFLMGETLNLMTLGGLALAVGMLVDDATVTVENIHRNRHLGKPLTVAILDGSEQIAIPALAATLTICIVFFPVVLLTGPARFLFTPLALAVVFSMLASYVLSRTLVPALARKLLEAEPPGTETAGTGAFARFNRWRDATFERFQNRYAAGLELALHHKGLVLGGASLCALLAFVLLGSVGLDFFPSIDTGQMRLHVRAAPGLRIEETEQVVAGVEEAIRKIVPANELETINSNIGLPLSYNLAFVQTDSLGGQDADVLVALKAEHAPTRNYMNAIRAKVAADFPGIQIYFQPADLVNQVLNFGMSSPLDVQVEGRDRQVSYGIARKLVARIQQVPGIVDTHISQVLNKPALRINVDRQRAALLGLSERDVANNLLTSLSSSAVVSPSFWIGPNGINYLVAVQTPLPQLSSVNDVMTTPLSAAGVGSNSAAYLGSISSMEPAQSVGLASHYTVQGVIDVMSAVEGRDLGATASDVQRIIDGLGDLPVGVKVTLRGQSESMYSSFKSLGLGLILAIVLVYLLMVVLFQSFLDPFIIMIAVPGALVGILWMLSLTGTTLNVESFMGAIMAVGIGVSNSILVVSFANEVRVEQKLNAFQAALLAGKTRLRPVLMTALAMLLGMLPMALGLGEGGEQNAPLGRAVIGGLLLATFVTLFVVPIVYAAIRTEDPTAHALDAKFALESVGAMSGPNPTPHTPAHS